MIEEELRAAFARHEDLVPDAEPLRPAIEAAARRRRRTRRMARTGVGAALAVALIAGVPAAFSARDVPVAQLLVPATSVPAGPLTFLIAGLDGRPNADPGERMRADTVMIAQVPADRSAIYLVTLPRDLRVDIPGYGTGKLAETYAHGGFPTLSRTATGLTGLNFDAAATVEFTGITRAVDEIGGLQVCLPRSVTSIHTGRTYPVGCRRFDGSSALDVLRQRKDQPYGVFDRDANQVLFLRALIRAAKADPLRVARAAGPSLTVDTGGADLEDLAFEVFKASDRVVGVATPVGPPVRIGDIHYVRLQPEAAGLFEALRTDRMGAWVVAHPGAVSRTGLAG